MSSNLIEFTKAVLDARNVSPDIIENVPLYVKRAVLDLQTNSQILPPKIVEFNAVEKKNEQRDTNGNVFFNFIYLPTDFLELDELFVFDQTDTTKGQSIPYQYTSYDNYINSFNTDDVRKYFSITDIVDPNGNYNKIVIFNPFPDDNVMIRVKYFVDGSIDSLDYIKERHWNVIINHVEAQLGLRTEESAKEAAAEESANWRNQEGISPVNSTPKRTKISYFGNIKRRKNRLR
jgi:hypothetical protein